MDYVKIFNEAENQLKTEENKLIKNRLIVIKKAAKDIIIESLPEANAHDYKSLMNYINELEKLRKEINKDSLFQKWIDEALFATDEYVQHIISRGRR